MKRPSLNDPWVMLKTAADLAERLKLPTDEHRSALRDALEKSLPGLDGFDLEQRLRREHQWSLPMLRTDVLDEAHSIAVEYLHQHVKQWVKRFNIVPHHNVGDTVSTTLYAEGMRIHLQGTVVEVRQETAEYDVCPTPASSLRWTTDNTITVDFEELHSIVPSPDEFRLEPPMVPSS